MVLCVCSKDLGRHFHHLPGEPDRQHNQATTGTKWQQTSKQEKSTSAQGVWMPKTIWPLLIFFLKIQTIIEAEAAIALTCYSKVNFETRMTPKIYNSETISTAVPSMTKWRNKGTTNAPPYENEKWSFPLSYVWFTSMPHLLRHALIKAKSSYKDAATDAQYRGCGILQNRIEWSA